MTAPRTYIGRGLPYIPVDDLSGRLIVIEGTDGVGRTTQIQLLRQWLEFEGYGVIDTDWTSSPLVASTIDLAKEGHAMNVLTLNLLYATDFADRLEHTIIPALRAGFVVLSDRYIYTAMARAAVRGADQDWIRNLFGFALQPDIVLYLRADVQSLVKRSLLYHGLDYWESGLDQNPGLDPYDSFIRYQRRLLREYDVLAREFGFVVVSARRTIQTTQANLRQRIAPVLSHEAPQPVEIPAGRSGRRDGSGRGLTATMVALISDVHGDAPGRSATPCYNVTEHARRLPRMGVQRHAARVVAIHYTRTAIDADSIGYLAQLPERTEVEIEGTRSLLAHGSPGHWANRTKDSVDRLRQDDMIRAVASCLHLTK